MVQVTYNHGVGKAGCIAALFFMTITFVSFLHTPAFAGALWWTAAEPVFKVDETQGPPLPREMCSREQIFLGHDLGKSDVCVVERGTWRYGNYTYLAPGTGYSEKGFAVGFGYDSKMYRMTGLPEVVPVSSSDVMVYRTTDANNHFNLNIVRDFQTKLTRHINPITIATEYSNDSSPEFTLKWSDGEPITVNAVGVSMNGVWLAAEVPESGIVLVNLQTLEVKKVASLQVPYWHGSNPSVQFAVSNDGKHIAVMGYNFFSSVIENTDSCGDVLPSFEERTKPMTKPCGQFDIYGFLQNKVNGYNYGYYPTFDEDGGQLNFLAGQNDGTMTWVTLTIAGYFLPGRLDYLALGDSFSSGEGDTEINPATREKYYLPHTDTEGSTTTPTETCHLSSRSYPFLLRSAMEIPAYRMKSIACSGAVGHVDYTQVNTGYDGQNGRLAMLNDPAAAEQYKTAGLNEFIPGRNQQIEFLKKYRPKAITLTAGGNDVGFGDVAIACAPPNITGSFRSSCDYTTSRGRARLGEAIRGQFDNLKGLYDALHSASPETKIYVIGYPQFVSDTREICALNVRFDKDERIMARAAVAYLNAVIKAAADASGVRYIDIEDSLGFHTLCGGEDPYVTGLTRSGKVTADITELFSHESFHPNAKGHRAMADAIQNAVGGVSLMNYPTCPKGIETICPNDSVTEPAPNPYFADAMSEDPTNYVHAKVTKGSYQKGKDAFGLSLTNLEPDSEASVRIFSEPIELGTYLVNSKGELAVSIPVPLSLPAGFHTIEVGAMTFSGEPITFWQIIEVHGADGDIDENGVSDDSQNCFFGIDSGTDADGDAIDDGCDPEIGHPVLVQIDDVRPPTEKNTGPSETSKISKAVAVIDGLPFALSSFSPNNNSFDGLVEHAGSNSMGLNPRDLSEKDSVHQTFKQDVSISPLSKYWMVSSIFFIALAAVAYWSLLRSYRGK